MDFEWDEAKNQSNIKKHLISFEEAQTIFEGEVFTVADDRFHYSEERYISLGELVLAQGSLIIAVVHTERGERTRLISARKASPREQRQYYEYIHHQGSA